MLRYFLLTLLPENNVMDNKTFIDTLANRIGVTKKEATLFSATLCNLIGDICVEGDIAVIPGFGSFETKKKLERVMTVPSSQGKRLLIPPKIVATFKPSALLKQRLNELKTTNDNAYE